MEHADRSAFCVSEADRSVSVFVDNQGFSPLCLVRKHVETEGSSAGVWT